MEVGHVGRPQRKRRVDHANAINEQARGDPDALAPHIMAALGKAGYRIAPATRDGDDHRSAAALSDQARADCPDSEFRGPHGVLCRPAPTRSSGSSSRTLSAPPAVSTL